jgi:voltage-gated potassium channel
VTRFPVVARFRGDRVSLWHFGGVTSLLSTGVTRPTGRRLLVSVLRVLALLVVMLGIYMVIPVTPNSELSNWAILAVGLVGFVGVMIWQLNAVFHSDRPIGRALEALCICLSLYLVIFATQYLAESLETQSAFSEPLDKLAAFYFTVTVFATVGFGDISPVSDVARVITTVQMVGDLIVLGLGVRLLAGLAQERLRVQRDGADVATTAAED